MTAEALHARVRTLCVHPVRVTFSMESIEQRRQALQLQIEMHLRAAGFEVVAGDLLEEVWTRVVRGEGGFYDPHTGWRDEDRYRSIRRLAAGEARRELGCDAMLFASVVPVTATFVSGTVEWDGVRESLPGTYNQQGWVGALSLHVSIVDMADNEIYFFTGGIQPLGNFDAGFFRSAFVPAEEGEVLADERRRERAIHLALGPLFPPSMATPTRTPRIVGEDDRMTVRERMMHERMPTPLPTATAAPGA